MGNLWLSMNFCLFALTVSMLANNLQLANSLPTRPTHVLIKTLTVIEKPSCFVLPTSITLPTCDSKRKKRWLQMENWPVWDPWPQHFPPPPQPDDEESDESIDFPENIDSISTTFIEPSITQPVPPMYINNPPLAWGILSHKNEVPVTLSSTLLITKTAPNVQRLVPDCLDSDEMYEPICSAKPVKKEWGYHGIHNSDEWQKIDVTCASGEEESPIEIKFDETIPAKFSELELMGYATYPSEYLVSNNGHTLVLSMKNSVQPEAKKGGLRSDYVFSQMHFHWGETSEQGSEHVIDGKRYPMEIHMVHYNKNYGAVEKAIAHRDGLEVLAIFVEISPTKNPIFDPLVDVLDDLIEPDSNKTLPGDSFLLEQFLPTSGGFYRYHGSLTTPNCNQAVYWTIFSDPITISEEQIDGFRKLMDHANESLAGNYRPLQKLFGREVFRNF